MGRPATGKTKVMGFRPPKPLRDEFEQLAASEGRTPSDALIEAMHDWVKKKRRERVTEGPSEGPRTLDEESDNNPK
jgi:hypothetical protein